LGNGRGEDAAIAEGASLVLHQGVAVVAVGEEEPGAHGRTLPLVVGVGRDFERGELGKEGLDAARTSVPVEEQGKKHQQKNQECYEKVSGCAV
jgi:hypothetical protein